MLCFFPVSFMSSIYTDKNGHFSRFTKRHSQFGTFSQPCSNRTFSNYFSHNSPAGGWDRTDFAQEEQLGLRYWTMILAICALVDVSNYLDIPTLEFLITLVRLPFLPGCKRILRLLLVLRILEVWIYCPWLLRLSFVMLMILVRWILRKTLNHLSHCHLGVQLDLCIFDVLIPTLNSWDDSDLFSTQNVLLILLSLLQRSPLCFWLSSVAMPVFSSFLILCPVPLSHLVFPLLEALE